MPLAQAHMKRTRRGVKGNRVRQLARLLEAGLYIALFLIFVYYLASYITGSGQYAVRNILVIGAGAVTTDEVRAAAALDSADNLLFVDREAVARRVAALPYVARAEVQREFPNTIVVSISEREAVATLIAGRRAFLIDREGYVLRETEPSADPTGPLITNVPDLGVVTPGDRLTQPALREALALWDAFGPAPIAREVTVSEISAESPVHLTMILEEVPFAIRWGRSDHATQAERLSVLWREKAGQLPCVEYLDLRFDQDLVCR